MKCDPIYHEANKLRNSDARGIPLPATCDRCHNEVMSRYRADVLDDPNYWHDEPLDDE